MSSPPTMSRPEARMIARYEDRRQHRDELPDDVAAEPVRRRFGAQQRPVFAIGREILNGERSMPSATSMPMTLGSMREPSEKPATSNLVSRRKNMTTSVTTGHRTWPNRPPDVSSRVGSLTILATSGARRYRVTSRTTEGEGTTTAPATLGVRPRAGGFCAPRALWRPRPCLSNRPHRPPNQKPKLYLSVNRYDRASRL